MSEIINLLTPAKPAQTQDALEDRVMGNLAMVTSQFRIKIATFETSILLASESLCERMGGASEGEWPGPEEEWPEMTAMAAEIKVAYKTMLAFRDLLNTAEKTHRRVAQHLGEQRCKRFAHFHC